MRRVSQKEFAKILSENTQIHEDIFIKKKSLLQNFFSKTDSLSETLRDTFDGNGHTITNIPKKLFSCIEEEGILKNITIKLCEDRTGSVICETNKGTIKNCELVGDITITETEDVSEKIGGLVDFNSKSGKIVNCKTSVTVEGDSFVGGICGINKGEVVNCKNSGDIKGRSSVGGICGRNFESVERCETENSNVSGEYHYGGICGFSKYSMIKRCSVINCCISHIQNEGEVFRSGGICGNTEEGEIQNCISQDTTIEGQKAVGGLCGRVYQGSIRNSKVKENVTVDGNEECGGIAGVSVGSVFENIISKGLVRGGDKTGGVVGKSDGEFTNVLSSALVNYNVQDSIHIGSFFGESNEAKIDECYQYGTDSKHTLIGNLNDTDIVKSEASEQELRCVIGF